MNGMNRKVPPKKQGPKPPTAGCIAFKYVDADLYVLILKRRWTAAFRNLIHVVTVGEGLDSPTPTNLQKVERCTDDELELLCTVNTPDDLWVDEFRIPDSWTRGWNDGATHRLELVKEEASREMARRRSTPDEYRALFADKPRMTLPKGKVENDAGTEQTALAELYEEALVPSDDVRIEGSPLYFEGKYDTLTCYPVRLAQKWDDKPCYDTISSVETSCAQWERLRSEQDVTLLKLPVCSKNVMLQFLKTALGQAHCAAPQFAAKRLHGSLEPLEQRECKFQRVGDPTEHCSDGASTIPNSPIQDLVPEEEGEKEEETEKREEAQSHETDAEVREGEKDPEDEGNDEGSDIAIDDIDDEEPFLRKHAPDGEEEDDEDEEDEEDDKDSMICVVCQHELQEPVALPCHPDHRFCKRCIDDIVAHSVECKSGRCPLCRTGFEIGRHGGPRVPKVDALSLSEANTEDNNDQAQERHLWNLQDTEAQITAMKRRQAEQLKPLRRRLAEARRAVDKNVPAFACWPRAHWGKGASQTASEEAELRPIVKRVLAQCWKVSDTQLCVSRWAADPRNHAWNFSRLVFNEWCAQHPGMFCRRNVGSLTTAIQNLSKELIRELTLMDQNGQSEGGQ